jgi:hypothetical protein
MTRRLASVLFGLSILATALPLFAEEGFPQSFEVSSTERVNFPPGGTIRLNQPSLAIANTRIVSRSMRCGADIRTVPVGGYTLRWTFLMSFFTTSTAISPRCILSAINIPAAL